MKENFALSLKARLQVLRLLNRATDTLSRINPQKDFNKANDEADPFTMSDMKVALPDASGKSPERSPERKALPAVTQLDGLEWRVATALLGIQFSLTEAYANRGSAREAQYFIRQAEELAKVLGSPTMTSRALLLRSEIQFALGQHDEAQETLTEANEVLHEPTTLDLVDVHRAMGDQLVQHANEADAQEEFKSAMRLLAQTQESFCAIDNLVIAKRKVDGEEFFAPLQRGKILRQQGKDDRALCLAI